MRHRLLLCFLSLPPVFAVSGCFAHSPLPGCGPGLQEYRRTELYFGLQRENGRVIESSTFDVFVESYVTPVLSTGFTMHDAQGRYLVDQKDVREPSRVMVVLHRAEPAVNAALERVRADYKKLFAQTSVLRVDMSVCAEF